MATFLTSVLNSEPIFFVSSYDPAIDWGKTQAGGMTRADYINNPFEQVHKLHKKDGEEFIESSLTLHDKSTLLWPCRLPGLATMKTEPCHLLAAMTWLRGCERRWAAPCSSEARASLRC